MILNLKKIYRDVIKKMIEPTNLLHITQRLQSFSYANGVLDTPNVDLFAKDVGVIIGPKIWQNLAKEELIKEILTGLKLEK